MLLQEQFEERLKTSKSFLGDMSHIIEAYNRNPILFSKWLSKADTNANRKGFGGKEYSMAIAANFVLNIERFKYFHCYYCDIDFLKNSQILIELEHFIPGRQEIGNIIPACSECNRIKKDNDFDYYSRLLYNDPDLKGLQPKSKHFFPLVFRHYGSNLDMYGIERFAWLNMMKKFAFQDFGIDINNINSSIVTEKYARLYRNKYYKYNEID